MVWQKMRRRREFKCPKCKGTYTYDEYDEDDDMCMYCLFPEAQRTANVPINHSYGFNKNETEEGYVMNNLENIPTKKRNFPFTKQDMRLLNEIKRKKRRSF